MNSRSEGTAQMFLAPLTWGHRSFVALLRATCRRPPPGVFHPPPPYRSGKFQAMVLYGNLGYYWIVESQSHRRSGKFPSTASESPRRGLGNVARGQSEAATPGQETKTIASPAGAAEASTTQSKYRSSNSILFFRSNEINSSLNDRRVWCAAWFRIYRRTAPTCDSLTENAAYPVCHAKLALSGNV